MTKKLTKINNWNKQGTTANQQEEKTGKPGFKKNKIIGNSYKGNFNRERQISYDTAYMWNLKNGTNEPIYKTEIESQM